MEQQLLTLQVMAAGHGHQDRKYNPNDPEEVRKIKAFVKKKIDEGWILYGMKSGEKMMTKIADNELKKLDDDKLDRFILAGHHKVEKKLLAQPITGG